MGGVDFLNGGHGDDRLNANDGEMKGGPGIDTCRNGVPLSGCDFTP